MIIIIGSHVAFADCSAFFTCIYTCMRSYYHYYRLTCCICRLQHFFTCIYTCMHSYMHALLLLSLIEAHMLHLQIAAFFQPLPCASCVLAPLSLDPPPTCSMHACMHVCMYIAPPPLDPPPTCSMHVCAYVSMYVCMCVYECMYIPPT
jgi:hypothetical protein